MKKNKKEPKAKIMAHGAVEYPKVISWSKTFKVLHIPTGTIDEYGIDISISSLREWEKYFKDLADFYEV